METAFLKLLNVSISACGLISAVILFRPLLKKTSRIFPCIMWILVAVRLICPFSIESVLSLNIGTAAIADSLVSAEMSVSDSSGLNDPAGGREVNTADKQINNEFPEFSAPAANVKDIRLSIIHAASIIWLTGMTAMLLYLLISCIHLHRQLSTAVYLEKNIWISDEIQSPFISGLLCPRIYLPSDLDKQHLIYVLTHENTHMKHHDYWWKPLGFLILTVHWFNPLVWAAYFLFCRDIELACDETVIRTLGTDCRQAYSRALLSCSIPEKKRLFCPLSFGESSIKERIKAVMFYKKPGFRAIMTSIAVCILLTVCFLTDPKGTDSQTSDFVSTDLNQDGIPEKIQVLYPGPAENEAERSDTENTGSRTYGSETYELQVIQDGEIIFSLEAGLPHPGWTSLFLCRLNGKDYLLKYEPFMYQGYATYSFWLFTVTPDSCLDSGYVEFNINGTDFLPVNEMLSFADQLNSYLENSTVLISTLEGDAIVGPGSAESFYETYSWVYDPTAFKSDIKDTDTLDTALEKYSQGAHEYYLQYKKTLN
ncbi:MAG: M56 family metallopeptidase [Lachnospiraceae bacterium]|nr:M56 family metallopeptidase [Lachnospiraceae bacterium]